MVKSRELIVNFMLLSPDFNHLNNETNIKVFSYNKYKNLTVPQECITLHTSQL